MVKRVLRGATEQGRAEIGTRSGRGLAPDGGSPGSGGVAATWLLLSRRGNDVVVATTSSGGLAHGVAAEADGVVDLRGQADVAGRVAQELVRVEVAAQSLDVGPVLAQRGD